MKRQRLDIEALRAALDAKRQELEISWREVSRQAKVNPSTLTRLGGTPPKRPDVDSFAALVDWLGLPAERFLVSAESVSPINTMAVISTYLKSDRQLSEKSAEALQEILQAAYKRLKKLDESDSRIQD